MDVICRRTVGLRAGAWLCSILLQFPCAQGTLSWECSRLVTQASKRQGSNSSELCQPVCGKLDRAAGEASFTEKLSERCRVAMGTYQATLPPETGLVNPAAWGKCATKQGSSTGSNPVVVASRNTSPFIMCTVPKVACTNQRKLLRALMVAPRNSSWQMPATARGQAIHAHAGKYSTLWHYQHEAEPLDNRFPSFVVGRNPCALRAAGCKCEAKCTVRSGNSRQHIRKAVLYSWRERATGRCETVPDQAGERNRLGGRSAMIQVHAHAIWLPRQACCQQSPLA